MDDIKVGRLNNGLKYLINTNKCATNTNIYYFIRVGSKHEKENESGMAHFLEHMLFKGTENYKSNIELNEKIDDLAASTNASTMKNMTSYYLKLPNENVIEGIKLLTDMVFFSTIKGNELEKEKDVVFEEINKTFDDSENFIEDLLSYYLFKDSKLQHYIMGEKKILEKMKRKDLLSFYKRYYIPSNSILVISGNVPKNLAKNLSKFINFKSNTNKIIHNYDLHCFSKKVKIVSVNRNHFQITIGIAFPLFNCFDKRRFLLDILIAHFDGLLTSKLWIELRENNGLVYGADANYELFEEGGIFQIIYSLEKKNVFKSIELIRKIIDDFKNRKIKNEEFERYKNFIIKNVDIEKEDNLEVSNFYGEQYLFSDNLVTHSQLKEKYLKYNLDELYDLADFIFDYNKMTIIQIGDIKNKIFSKKTKKIFDFI